LGERELAPLEEHLLACESCQAKLQLIDQFVLAMKQAGPNTIDAAVSGGWRTRVEESPRGWLALSAVRAALAGALAVLLTVAIVERPRSADQPPETVTLKSLRGGDLGDLPTAPVGRPLALAIVAPDIASCDPCRVEIVNASGRAAWSGKASIDGGRLSVIAPGGLKAGMYWVRLYAGEELEREFGLRLE
jgi:hypothetical protein